MCVCVCVRGRGRFFLESLECECAESVLDFSAAAAVLWGGIIYLGWIKFAA